MSPPLRWSLSCLAVLAACGGPPALDGGLPLDDAGVLADAGVGPLSDAGVPTGDGGPPGSADAGPDFLAPELLARPTDTSVALGLLPGRELEVSVEAGPPGGPLQVVVPIRVLPAGAPAALELTGLPPNAAWTYRVRWRTPGIGSFTEGPLRTFHTARTPGAGFTFTIQADSHLDENSVLAQYQQTLANVRADAPDFHVDLGDTFMCEKHDQPFVAPMVPAPDEATVIARYRFERTHFGLVSPSVPLFLVNGNHDGELGYLSTGSGGDLATWTTHARQDYFLPPVPGPFFKGDARSLPFVGQRGAFYAFTWGDALFVMLDPFWETMQRPGRNGWTMTLGPTQYAWLAQVLRGSPARFKFVFLHNLVGGLDGAQRGGIEAAPYFEWGGRELDGGTTFATNRPASAGWEKPIHPLLVETGVTAVFHGHDHLYAHQSLDGVVYQAVPQPSARNTNNAAMLAAQYHYDAGTVLASDGHLRVRVSGTSVTSEYVRSWLPPQETNGHRNGEVAHSWTETR